VNLYLFLVQSLIIANARVAAAAMLGRCNELNEKNAPSSSGGAW
jgi:hypothetical protein